MGEARKERGGTERSATAGGTRGSRTDAVGHGVTGTLASMQRTAGNRATAQAVQRLIDPEMYERRDAKDAKQDLSLQSLLPLPSHTLPLAIPATPLLHNLKASISVTEASKAGFDAGVMKKGISYSLQRRRLARKLSGALLKPSFTQCIAGLTWLNCSVGFTAGEMTANLRDAESVLVGLERLQIPISLSGELPPDIREAAGFGNVTVKLNIEFTVSMSSLVDDKRREAAKKVEDGLDEAKKNFSKLGEELEEVKRKLKWEPDPTERKILNRDRKGILDEMREAGRKSRAFQKDLDSLRNVERGAVTSAADSAMADAVQEAASKTIKGIVLDALPELVNAGELLIPGVDLVVGAIDVGMALAWLVNQIEHFKPPEDTLPYDVWEEGRQAPPDRGLPHRPGPLPMQ